MQRSRRPRIEAPAVDSTFHTWNSGGYGVIAARHAEVADDELREERQVEADEDVRNAANFAQPLGDTSGR